MQNNQQSTSIITLDSSLEALQKRFNAEKDKIRFIALLSPTCPLWRDQGARAVQENIFNKYPNANIIASIVWIPILEKDSLEAAKPSAKLMSDGRIQHFYDPFKAVGKIIADSVGWSDNIAWDIYLFYLPQTVWSKAPPKPKFWMHQLKDHWASSAQYRTGDDLKSKLSNSMRKLLILWALYIAA